MNIIYVEPKWTLLYATEVEVESVKVLWLKRKAKKRYFIASLVCNSYKAVEEFKNNGRVKIEGLPKNYRLMMGSSVHCCGCHYFFNNKFN